MIVYHPPVAGIPTDVARLWAITSYFNPMGWKSRLANYHVFRKNLPMPLVTVELSFDGEYRLQDADADILVRVDDGDVMWQKERLLNVAISALPADCDFVAWLDCDIVSVSSRWPESICNALGRCPMAQGFSTAWHARSPSLDAGDQSRRKRGKQSSLSRGPVQGTIPDDVFSLHGGHGIYGYWPGFAWAARREVVDSAGLYDTMILGTSDKAIYSAAYGKSEEFIRALELHESLADHYREWATGFHDLVQGKVGFAEAEIQHLWHGTMSNRAFRRKYEGFQRFEFDPCRDLRLGKSGAWRWASAKPGLHEHVAQYLRDRKEDG